MKVINNELLDCLTEEAKVSPRLRMNYNFHEKLDDKVNRLLNAILPESYLRPHRHLNPDKEEIFLLLRGSAVLVLFDEQGKVTEKLLLDPLKGSYGAEIKPGIWHTLVILEPGTVVYEVKEGPFAPLSPDNFAPWSPDVEDTEAVKEYQQYLYKLVTTD